MASRVISTAIFAVLLGACAPTSYDTPYAPAPPSIAASPVSLSVESEHGAALPVHHLGRDAFVEGRRGEGYVLRLTNHSAERYEAVVSVDGRDVVSGELGHPARQRGYVLEPYETLVIDGYRRSMDDVAAFYFSGIRDSYSARRGTPEHVGVIGVALFSEKQRRPRSRPLTRQAKSAPPDPFPRAGASVDRAAEAEADGADMAYAPAEEHLGTGYGADTYSPVYETEFKRRRRRRPDTVLTVYYDSYEGLQARGVLPYEPYVAPVRYDDPEPYEPRRARPPWERDG